MTSPRLTLAMVLAISLAPACRSFGSPTQTLGCPRFAAGVERGRIVSNEIREASGIAASHRNPGVYYLNNDSGDRPRIFAIDERGRDLGTYLLEGAHAVDWEDIAVGPAHGQSGSFVYVADIGDNNHQREWIVIYRVPEPDVSKRGAPHAFDRATVVALRLQYPDGESHNAETLMIDPRNADLYIVTKVRNGPARVFRHPAPHLRDEIATLEDVGSLRLGSPLIPGSEMVTGGDISSERNQILLRTYSQVFIWQRGPEQSIAQALSRPPCVAPQRPEPQGEAISWRLDESGYVTVSEKAHQPIYFFSRLPD